jgi:hypothetical protein
VISQWIKNSTLSVFSGHSNFLLQSRWQVRSNLSADLYVLQVLFAMLKFPSSAKESFTSSGKSMFRNTVVLQLPLFPYLKDPFMLAGVKIPPVIRENYFQPVVKE